MDLKFLSFLCLRALQVQFFKRFSMFASLPDEQKARNLTENIVLSQFNKLLTVSSYILLPRLRPRGLRGGSYDVHLHA